MSKSGLYEFEFIADSIGDTIAVSFSVAEGSVSAERELLFKEFYESYWDMVDMVDEAKKGD